MKKDSQQIASYYKKSDVVKGYDRRRFTGVGGSYIDQGEQGPIAHYIRMISSKQSNILELGAGRGRLTKVLTQRKSQVYCLEWSKEMVKYLKKIVPTRHILLQSIFDPISKKNTFQIITSLRFFDHFDRKDHNKILKNTYQVIDRSGWFIYSGVNKNSLEGLIAQFFPYGRYNYFYSEAELQKIFRKAKFEVVDSQGRFILPRGVFLHSPFDLITNILIGIDTILIKLLPQFCSYQVYLLRPL